MFGTLVPLTTITIIIVLFGPGLNKVTQNNLSKKKLFFQNIYRMISIIVPLGNKPGIVLLLSVSLPAGIMIVIVVVPRNILLENIRNQTNQTYDRHIEHHSNHPNNYIDTFLTAD